ncbi:MAG: group III truncated hemoglobin [Bacteroidota bacterium]|nr:group III truncated hemoglobin [Bacteroidota bacterium]
MKVDLQNRADIELLVNTFYDKIRTDSVIGYFFNDVAQTDWEHHLPKMYDFWEVILFGTGHFKGNPMFVHKQLNMQSPMKEEHFLHWLEVFHATVDELFEGKNAEDIKMSASNIAKTMSYKVLRAGY